MNLDIVRVEAARLARAGKKIEAVKLVRERVGLGLKEAKEFVEALEHAAAHLPSSHTTSHQLPMHTTSHQMPPHAEVPLRSNAEQKPPSSLPLLLIVVFLISLAGYFYLNM